MSSGHVVPDPLGISHFLNVREKGLRNRKDSDTDHSRHKLITAQSANCAWAVVGTCLELYDRELRPSFASTFSPCPSLPPPVSACSRRRVGPPLLFAGRVPQRDGFLYAVRPERQLFASGLSRLGWLAG